MSTTRGGFSWGRGTRSNDHCGLLISDCGLEDVHEIAHDVGGGRHRNRGDRRDAGRRAQTPRQGDLFRDGGRRQPLYLSGRQTHRVLAELGRPGQGSAAQQPLDGRCRRLARARADARRLARQLPVWSPDGTRIAFLSDRDGTYQLHVMYVDTGEVAQLTHLDAVAAGDHLVARQQADRVHAADAGRGSDPQGGTAEAAARRRVGEAGGHRRSPDVGSRRHGARGKGLHAHLRRRRRAGRHAAPDQRRQVQPRRPGVVVRRQDDLRRRASGRRKRSICATTARSTRSIWRRARSRR